MSCHRDRQSVQGNFKIIHKNPMISREHFYKLMLYTKMNHNFLSELRHMTSFDIHKMLMMWSSDQLLNDVISVLFFLEQYFGIVLPYHGIFLGCNK